MSAQYLLSLVILTCFAVDIFGQDCGRGKSEFVGYVAGGKNTTRGDWPWLVALIHTDYDRFFCGGSLISAKHVLSAAHCFQYTRETECISPHLVRAYLGRYNLSDENETGPSSHSISDIIIHPEWKQNRNNLDNYDADIAILLLKVATPFNRFVQPVCLPEHNDNAVTGTGVVAGWGKSQSSDQLNQPTPSELRVPAVGGNTCYTKVPKLSKYSSDRMFCGGFLSQGQAACSGDSGGGFYSLDETWTIRGIVSGGLITPMGGCNVDAYTLFTNVAKFRGWITEVMESRIDRVKVAFNCKIGCEGCNFAECDYTHDGPITSNLKFSAEITSPNASHMPRDVKEALINFPPSDHVFAGIGAEFQNIEKLHIYGESIEFVERRNFADMTQLSSLSLIQLSTKFLPADLLRDLPNLERVDFEDCKLEKIPEKLFSNQSKLYYVKLDGNKLEVLDKDLFEFNLRLIAISLRNNNLKKIFVDFTRLPALRLVDLVGNACLKRYWSKKEMISLEAYQQDIRTCCGEMRSRIDPKCSIAGAFLPPRP